MKGPQKELMSLLGSGGWREEIAGRLGWQRVLKDA